VICPLCQILAQSVKNIGDSGVIIVHGEADVGKSALALGAIGSIRSGGGVAIALSLRDVPPAAVSLREALGIEPGALFSAASSAPTSVLLLDGAEIVQESRSGAIGALLTAAREVTWVVILVVRDDALESVVELLSTHGVVHPARFEVAPLSTSEIKALVGGVPDLAGLAADPRAVWLLRRLGLVEILLKAAQCGRGLPQVLSSEAEVFATAWTSLVRQDEAIVRGVSADDREAAVLQIARQLLTDNRSLFVPGMALSSLRSDGILISYGRTKAWSTGDQFASDVLRDFAVARLLVREGIRVLIDSPAPRWSVRAVRLFAQARLSAVALLPAGAMSQEWVRLRGDFEELSRLHGARWKELLWEAVLTAGWVGRALSELQAHFLAQSELLNAIVQTLKLRFSDNGACNATVGAPLVLWQVSTPEILKLRDRHSDDPIGESILYWLRGVARLQVEGEDVSAFRSLRSVLADVLVRAPIEYGDEKTLEALGLLAEEASDATKSALRAFADESPGFLDSLVESSDVARILSQQDATLLAELTEKYYVELPRRNKRPFAHRDEGIRGHKPAGSRLPLAAWYRGPFLPLLRCEFSRTLKVIERMLDRGAVARVEILRDLARNLGDDNSALKPSELRLFGAGPRQFAGDPHVWGWYRGSSVGPYPCMSALFCLEIFLDDCVRSGYKPSVLARTILRDATTLASVGLCYGFLVRHLDPMGNDLDDFLAVPKIWCLEFGRVASEGRLHVQGPDPSIIRGSDRRTWTPHHVAMYQIVAAGQAGNTERLSQIRDIGRRLVEAAGGSSAPPEVQQWAASLDSTKYTQHREDNRLIFAVTPPEEVTAALEPVWARQDQQGEMYALLNRYLPQRITPYQCALAELPSDEDLARDIAIARGLPEVLPDEYPGALHSAMAGVAAAAVRRASGAAPRPTTSEDIIWALSLLIGYARGSRLASISTLPL
jgi:hypothetical protein